MKRYLAEKYCLGRWCLCVDADELFDYPFSAKVTLYELLSYLRECGYNAVVTQMLDMFSEVPLARLKSNPEDDLKSTYRYYDLTGIVQVPYADGEADKSLMAHFGGIRRLVFGSNNGLTKVSLFFMDGKLKPFFRWHHARNAKIADISCLLLHYPFVSSFYEKVVEAVRSGRYGYLTSDEYASYLKGLEESPELRLKLTSARELICVDELIATQFLMVSPRFRVKAGAYGAGKAEGPPAGTVGDLG
jgi:hypothetical protein